MFKVEETQESALAIQEHVCAVCDSRPSIVRCGCCETPVETCGACCLLRHTEQRYQVHAPDETSDMFEYVAKLKEEQPDDARPKRKPKLEPQKGLVLIAAFDGIGGARRAVEILGIKPAMYISIETDAECGAVVRKAWPEVETLNDVRDVNGPERGGMRLSELLRSMPHLDTGMRPTVPRSLDIEPTVQGV